jgi:hypothetical protein
MPYMLELAAILAIAVQDYIDFAIIMAILLCNGYLGFHEELKAKASLDELTNKMEQKIAVLRDGAAEHMLTRLLVPGDVVLMVGGCATPADVEWIEGLITRLNSIHVHISNVGFSNLRYMHSSRYANIQAISCQLIQRPSLGSLSPVNTLVINMAH